MNLSKTQIAALRKVKARGSVSPDALNRNTLQSLLMRGMLKQSPRLYFGPRDLRYMLSTYGEKVLSEVDEAGGDS